MQEPHVFEYAVIRIVPRVEREEFLNAGVILYCPKQKFLQAKITLNEARLQAFGPSLDLDEVKKNLCVFAQICEGHSGSGPIGKLERAARFRWLTATRSTVVQLSKVHPGLCTDAGATLAHLHEQLVAL